MEVWPCTAKGKIFKPEDDVFVDDPSQLIGQDFHFKVKVTGARGLPKRYNVSKTRHNLLPAIDFQIGEPLCLLRRSTTCPDLSLYFKEQEFMPVICLTSSHGKTVVSSHVYW